MTFEEMEELKYKPTWQEIREQSGKDAAHKLAHLVNNCSHTSDAFIGELKVEHQTLQQSVTRLMLEWLEYVGSDEYWYDARNHRNPVYP